MWNQLLWEPFVNKGTAGRSFSASDLSETIWCPLFRALRMPATKRWQCHAVDQKLNIKDGRSNQM